MNMIGRLWRHAQSYKPADNAVRRSSTLPITGGCSVTAKARRPLRGSAWAIVAIALAAVLLTRGG